jgi:2-oxoglutarate ferredoxin oxidoreductase subunit beta
VLDIISPCVQFNNHAGSTKSFDFVREHNEAVNRLDFIVDRKEITADYAPGTVRVVQQHDGTFLKLSKLHDSYDPTNRAAAMAYIQERHNAGEVVTGLLYLEEQADDLHANLNTVATPLNRLAERELCPGAAKLADINAEYR